MRTFNHTIARAMIWLAAIAVPAQNLAVGSCGCSVTDACCEAPWEEARVCCCSSKTVREARCCCSQQKSATRHSCCKESRKSHESACQCGVNCQCGKVQHPEPAAPPSENNSEQRLAADALCTASLAALCDRPFAGPHLSAFAESQACTALNRCVSLCRLTL